MSFFLVNEYYFVDEVVSIPGWVTRGAGASTHHEYEVRICLGDSCRWLLLRRYRRFRDLYLTMKRSYGPKVILKQAAVTCSKSLTTFVQANRYKYLLTVCHKCKDSKSASALAQTCAAKILWISPRTILLDLWRPFLR